MANKSKGSKGATKPARSNQSKSSSGNKSSRATTPKKSNSGKGAAKSSGLQLFRRSNAPQKTLDAVVGGLKVGAGASLVYFAAGVLPFWKTGWWMVGKQAGLALGLALLVAKSGGSLKEVAYGGASVPLINGLREAFPTWADKLAGVQPFQLASGDGLGNLVEINPNSSALDQMW